MSFKYGQVNNQASYHIYKHTREHSVARILKKEKGFLGGHPGRGRAAMFLSWTVLTEGRWH